jgi:hypothetical protein
MNGTRTQARPCEPDCQGYADYAAVPCPNPACDDRVKTAWERARQAATATEAGPAQPRPKRPQYGECPYCEAREDARCAADCPAIDPMDYR